MAIYRNIQMSFWTDTKVADDFTPEDRYFYLYLFTNPHTNLAGCYEISIRQMSNETGYSKDTIERLIDRFSKVHNVINYDPNNKEMLLMNWHKYNWTKSSDFRKALIKEIDNVKNQVFMQYLRDLYDGVETVPRPSLDGVGTTDTVTDIYINNNTKTINTNKTIYKRFKPPTVDEVRAYCQERGNFVDPESFINFYESKGWMVGSNKMKDWKAAVRTWESKDKKRGLVPKQNQPMKTIRIENQSQDEITKFPYYGFPKEWFKGDLITSALIGPVRDADTGKEYTPDEIVELYYLRRERAFGNEEDLEFRHGT